MQPSEYSLSTVDAKNTDLDIEHGLADRRGHDTSMTRETVEEMIAAALSRAALNPRTVARTENDKGRLEQYQKKIAVLEHQRDEALQRNAVVEDEHLQDLEKIKVLADERDEAFETIKVLQTERDEALDKADQAEIDVHNAWVKADKIWDDASTKVGDKQKELNDMLAIIEAKEAKVAHLESQLAKIHSLSKNDETVVSSSARPDSAGSEDRTELASHDNILPGTWVDPRPGSGQKWETRTWD